MRWPSFGSRPVVSVSITNSRIARFYAIGILGSKLSQHGAQTAPGDGAAETARHDEIGAFAFFHIRHLALEERGKARRIHAWPRQDPVALQESGGGHHHRRVVAFVPSRFEEQRH